MYCHRWVVYLYVADHWSGTVRSGICRVNRIIISAQIGLNRAWVNPSACLRAHQARSTPR